MQSQRPGFDPWVGKIPGRRERLTTPVFWPENPMDRGTWQVPGLQRGQLLTPLPTKQLLNTTCQTMLSWSSWFKSKRWTRKQANRRMLSDGKRAGGFPFCPHGAEGRTQMKERPLFSWAVNLHLLLGKGFNTTTMWQGEAGAMAVSGGLNRLWCGSVIDAIQGTLKRLLQHHNSKDQFFGTQPSL